MFLNHVIKPLSRQRTRPKKTTKKDDEALLSRLNCQFLTMQGVPAHRRISCGFTSRYFSPLRKYNKPRPTEDRTFHSSNIIIIIIACCMDELEWRLCTRSNKTTPADLLKWNIKMKTIKKKKKKKRAQRPSAAVCVESHRNHNDDGDSMVGARCAGMAR